MAGQLKLRRGTTSQLANYVGAEGELTYDTVLKSLVLHDGVTLGGVKIPYLSNDLVPPTMLPTATESVVGTSKIATTAIAQAGLNDTDFITAKKLRDALNATGEAPIHACRGLLTFNGVGGATILSSNNIATLTRLSHARYSVVFIKPMPSANYIVVGSATDPNTGGTDGYVISLQKTAPTVNGFEFHTGYATSLGESPRVSIAVFGG